MPYTKTYTALFFLILLFFSSCDIFNPSYQRQLHPTNKRFETNKVSFSPDKFSVIKKGSAKFTLSAFCINAFNIKLTDGHYNSTGILGIGAGMDYYYKDDHYISLNTGLAGDGSFGEYFENRGYVQHGNTVFISLRNNYIINRFSIGYGINVSQLQWKRTTVGDTINLDASLKSTGIGLSLSTEYRIGEYFNIGLLYQPNLLKIDFNPAKNYQHFFSVSMIWKFPADD